MTQRKVSIAWQSDKPLSAYGPLAAAAESYGFDAVSVYNDLFFQPAWYPLLDMARQTSHVALGPAAVNPFTCHPIHIAGQIALLDEVSGGRAYLGLARGAWLQALGIAPIHPVQALAEAFAAVRHLLNRSDEGVEGTHFPVAAGHKLRWPAYSSGHVLPFLLGSLGTTHDRSLPVLYPGGKARWDGQSSGCQESACMVAGRSGYRCWISDGCR